MLAQSHARIHKERAMRRRKLKWLWARLKQIAAMELDREELLMKLGAARAKARAAWRLVDVAVAPEGATFSFTLDRAKLRQVRRREGRYLLRTNLTGKEPAELWRFYIQLVEIEAAFKTMKDDLQLRPIYHQLEQRIEAHIFVAFLAYCLHVTLRARLKPLAPGLTPRAVLDKFAAIQMLDVHFPTTDGRTLILSRYTELTAEQKMLVQQLKLDLPPQPPPRITAPGKPLASQPTSCSGDFRYAPVDITHFFRRVGKVGLEAFDLDVVFLERVADLARRQSEDARSLGLHPAGLFHRVDQTAPFPKRRARQPLRWRPYPPFRWAVRNRHRRAAA